LSGLVTGVSSAPVKIPSPRLADALECRGMDPETPSKSNLVMPLAMIVLGIYAVRAGARGILRHWSYLWLGARICDVLFVISGALLLIAGLWHLWTRGRQPAALAAGSLAAGLFALTLFVGVLTGTIPCSGPG
jgi:hypothetical protein